MHSRDMVFLGDTDGAWHPSTLGEAAGYRSKQVRRVRSLVCTVRSSIGWAFLNQEGAVEDPFTRRVDRAGHRIRSTPVQKGEGF